MKHHDNSSAKDFFLHLLSSITLYMSAIAFLMVAFQLINFLFPQAWIESWRSDYSSDTLRFGLSMLFIALPVFLGTRVFMTKIDKKHTDRKKFALRKWLVYFTLFAAAIIIIISLITIVNIFLSGEITTRFITKACTTIVVAAIIFSYYLYDVKNELTLMIRRLYLYGSIIITVALIASTFVVVGSPANARFAKVDTERLNSLNQITYSVEAYYNDAKELPESLDTLSSNSKAGIQMEDPITGEAYIYRIIDETTYELCAIFDTNTIEKKARDSSEYLNQDWPHVAGEQCFEKTVSYGNSAGAGRPIAW